MRENKVQPQKGASSIVTLDRAQLVGLGFFAVLSGGLMFGLGYSAGKARGRAVEDLRPLVAQTTLQQIDKKAELHEEIKQDADLTFYKTLVEKEEKQKAVPKSDAKTEVARLEAKPDALMKVDSAKVDTKVDTPAKAEAPAKPAEKPEEQALTSVVTVDDAPKTQPAMIEPKEIATKEVAPKELAKEPKEKGAFTIQVSAFKTQIEAASYVKLLAAKGFNAHVRSATVDGKGTWYRVRVGNFPTTAQAEIYKSKLSRENLPAWIVKAD